METEKIYEKSVNETIKLLDFICETTDETEFKKIKKLAKFFIEKQIQNLYMIDQRYYKEYSNMLHNQLIFINELETI